MAGARGHEMAAFRASILFYLLLCFMLETTSGDLASLNVTRHHQDRFTEECKICSSKKAECFGTQTCECRPSNSVFQINKGECTVGRDIIAENGCMDWHDDPNNGDDYLQLINLRNKSPHRYRFVLSPNILMCSIPKSAKASVKILDSAGSWKPKELPVSSPGDKRIGPVSINGSSLQICGGPDLDSAGAGYIIKVTFSCWTQDAQIVRRCLIFKASGTLTSTKHGQVAISTQGGMLSRSTKTPSRVRKAYSSPPSSDSHQGNGKNNLSTKVGIAIVAIIGALVGISVMWIVILLILWQRRRRRHNNYNVTVIHNPVASRQNLYSNEPDYDEVPEIGFRAPGRAHGNDMYEFSFCNPAFAPLPRSRKFTDPLPGSPVGQGKKKKKTRRLSHYEDLKPGEIFSRDQIDDTDCSVYHSLAKGTKKTKVKKKEPDTQVRKQSVYEDLNPGSKRESFYASLTGPVSKQLPKQKEHCLKTVNGTKIPADLVSECDIPHELGHNSETVDPSTSVSQNRDNGANQTEAGNKNETNSGTSFLGSSEVHETPSSPDYYVLEGPDSNESEVEQKSPKGDSPISEDPDNSLAPEYYVLEGPVDNGVDRTNANSMEDSEADLHISEDPDNSSSPEYYVLEGPDSKDNTVDQTNANSVEDSEADLHISEDPDNSSSPEYYVLEGPGSNDNGVDPPNAKSIEDSEADSHISEDPDNSSSPEYYVLEGPGSNDNGVDPPNAKSIEDSKADSHISEDPDNSLAPEYYVLEGPDSKDNGVDRTNANSMEDSEADLHISEDPDNSSSPEYYVLEGPDSKDNTVDQTNANSMEDSEADLHISEDPDNSSAPEYYVLEVPDSNDRPNANLTEKSEGDSPISEDPDNSSSPEYNVLEGPDSNDNGADPPNAKSTEDFEVDLQLEAP